MCRNRFRRFYFLFFIVLQILIMLYSPVYAKASGWETKGGGNIRYMTKNGYIKDKITEIHGKYYCFDKNGNRKTGWITRNNKKYFFGKRDGYAYTGARTVGEHLYLFRANGSLITGPQEHTLAGKNYIIDSDSHAYEIRNGLVKTDVLKKQGIDRCNRLMIVAHPDDEYYWGGAHLATYHDFFVVCLTNGNNPVRKTEFEKALEETGTKGIILTYPDKLNGSKVIWGNIEKPMLRKDILTLLTYKNWKQIVTHNPEGEYGHIHHILTNSLVTGMSEVCGKKNALFYFGKYYSPNSLKTCKNKLKEFRISQKNLDKKLRIVGDIYASQRNSYETLKHMAPYEGWVKATHWK